MPSRGEITTDTIKLEDFPVPPWVHLGMMKEEIARSSR